jgi:hypothetical protein
MTHCTSALRELLQRGFEVVYDLAGEHVWLGGLESL